MNEFINWYFETLDRPTSEREILLWWEKRRLVYNVFVVATAIVAFAVYSWFGQIIEKNTGAESGEPLVLFICVVAGPIAWNLAYCLGPIADIIRFTIHRKIFGSILLKTGLVFYLMILFLPAVSAALRLMSHSRI